MSLVLIFSVFTSCFIYYWSYKEEQLNRVLFAGKLTAQQDINTLYFLSSAEKKIAKEVALVHRSASFRGHLDSVQKVIDMAERGQIKLITEAEVTGIVGNGKVESVEITHQKDGVITHETDHFIPLFGLKPSLGPIADWGLEIEKNAIKVDTLDYSTNIPGIYAIGDVNTYENKLKLILCGFHEGTLAVQSAFARIYPDKKNILKYTTVNGVQGF
jgi:thioredoxin reductase (NADPH)